MNTIKTLESLKSELLAEFKEKKWWVGFKDRVTSTRDAKLTEKELWSFISSALDTVAKQTAEAVKIIPLSTKGECNHQVLSPKTCGVCKEVRAHNVAVVSQSLKRDKWLGRGK